MTTATLAALDIHTVGPITFQVFFDSARESSDQIAAATSSFEHIPGTTYRLSGDYESGFAVRPDGELVFVFSGVKGRGDALVSSAIGAGAKRLDCFDGYLTTLYSRHGFRVTDRAANWTPGGPDVVWMSL